MSASGLPPFGTNEWVEVPAWFKELEVEVAHAWALELDLLDPDVRDAALDAMP